jgi:uncharacterized protein DUF4157
MSGDGRELLSGSTREPSPPAEDTPARATEHAAGKLTRAELAPPVPSYPGKRTRLEDDPDAMSPAAALEYARWALQPIDRKADTTDVDRGALATAFAFLDRSRTGEPLPRPLAQRLGGALDADLSRVRVHTGAAAARAALLLGARAVTVGEDIYFAAGAYAPTTRTGIELIAHEAAHVAHRTHAAGVSRPDDSHERAADAFARDFVAASPRAGDGLPGALGEELAGALGADTSDVRIHTGAQADASARALGARAYTTGKDIYFADGEYQPASAAGRQLIAHEVAHTVQSGGATGSAVSAPGAAHERAADAFADAFAAGVPAPAVGTAPAGIHRDPRTPEEQLGEIQGLEMSVLLGKIPGLPEDVRTNYAAANKVGGPRLQAAMRAVNEPSDWKTYITKYSNIAAHLPKDQLDILMTKLGGPDKDFRYYKDVGNFDGTVDGTGHVITLIWRVRFVSAPVSEFDKTPQHPPEELKRIAEDSKKKIETTWSGKGTLKCAAPSVSPFTTKVEVQIVDAGEHSKITIQTGVRSSMNADTNDRDGTWSPGVERDQKNNVITYDQDGKQHVGPEVDQSTAAHEFGHAIGLHHVDSIKEAEAQLRSGKDKDGKPLSTAERKRLMDQVRDHRDMQTKIANHADQATGKKPGTSFHSADDDADYGSTEEEQRNIMGKGMEVKKIGGADAFDPFTPFAKIAKEWGKEFLKADKLNEWESSNV